MSLTVRGENKKYLSCHHPRDGISSPPEMAENQWVWDFPMSLMIGLLSCHKFDSKKTTPHIDFHQFAQVLHQELWKQGVHCIHFPFTSAHYQLFLAVELRCSTTCQGKRKGRHGDDPKRQVAENLEISKINFNFF